MQPAIAAIGEVVLALAVGAVALVFLISGASKLRAPKDFRANLLSIPYATPAASLVVAYALPVVETALAVGLVCGLGPARWLSIALLLAFNGVAAVVLGKDLELECSCFGGLHERSFSRRLIAVNFLYAAALAAAELAGPPDLSATSLGLSAALVFAGFAWPQIEDHGAALRDVRLMEAS